MSGSPASPIYCPSSPRSGDKRSRSPSPDGEEENAKRQKVLEKPVQVLTDEELAEVFAEAQRRVTAAATTRGFEVAVVDDKSKDGKDGTPILMFAPDKEDFKERHEDGLTCPDVSCFWHHASLSPKGGRDPFVFGYYLLVGYCFCEGEDLDNLKVHLLRETTLATSDDVRCKNSPYSVFWTVHDNGTFEHVCWMTPIACCTGPRPRRLKTPMPTFGLIEDK